VKAVSSESILQLVAQIKEDEIEFPVVALVRSPNYQLDSARMNFTMRQQGIQSVMDTETNEIFQERSLPVTLSYSLTILATNTIDMDELERELLFKYTSMYFLSINLPYEADRKIRFGIEVDFDQDIDRSSTTGEYLAEGKLHQTVIPLKCQGAVLVHYTPFKLKRTEVGYEIVTPGE